MQPLIDADIIRYEVGSTGQFVENKKKVIRSWEFVQKELDDKITEICKAVGATQAPILYLTGDAKLHERRSKREVLEPYKPNFRERVAKTKPYKGTRKNLKPFHFNNITSHLLSEYETVVSNGLEADDIICMEQYSRLDKKDTVICTRDKDLRMCPGYHYGWGCGLQEEVPLFYSTPFGSIQLKKNKIVGSGFKFFCSQILTGDSVDNIPGLFKCGPKKAYTFLEDCKTAEECFEAIHLAYKTSMGEGYENYLQEQINLLWLIREWNEDGTPRRFKL